MHRFSDHDTSLPVLLAHTAHGDLLIYQSYAYQPAASSTSLLRFTRFNHALITRLLSSTRASRPVQPNAAAAAAGAAGGGWLYGERFISLTSLSGHSCVLMTGYRPLLLFGQRDRLLLHDLLLERGAEKEEGDGELEADNEPAGEDSQQRLRRLHNGVACAVSFHNVQCQHGAVYIDIAGFVHIAELPPPPPLPSLAASASSTAITLVSPDNTSYTHFDQPFPVRIHPLVNTPRFLSYHVPTSSFAIVLSRPTAIQSIEEITPRSLTQTEETYELLLLSSPSTAAVLAGSAQAFGVIGRFDDFDAHEAVMCMAAVTLGGKTFIAIGTAIQQGEETAVKGRILLLDPYSATTSSTAAPLLKLRVFIQSEKGPVTCVSSLSSLLLAGIGMRVMLYEYDGKALVGRGFLDIEHDIVSVRVIKYYILLADVYASVTLACWDPICKQVIVLGRWREAGELTAVEWLVEGKQLSAIVAELSGAVSVLRWTPRVLPPAPPLPRDINNSTSLSLNDFFASVHSQRMQVKGELHIGSGVTRMEKYKMRERGRKHTSSAIAPPALGRAKSGSVGAAPLPLLPEADLTGRPHEQDRQPFNTDTNSPSLMSPASLPTAPSSVRSALLMSSMHGSLAVMHPLDDLQYRRLHSLASQVHMHVPMVGALNARQWGSVQRRNGRTGGAGRRGIVDGGLLRVWLGLDVDQQLLLCRMIGMQVEQVYDILLLNEHNTQLHV